MEDIPLGFILILFGFFVAAIVLTAIVIVWKQRRLQRFVISMYAFFSIGARPPFIFLSIAQRRALANTVFFCYNGGTRAKESFP